MIFVEYCIHRQATDCLETQLCSRGTFFGVLIIINDRLVIEFILLKSETVCFIQLYLQESDCLGKWCKREISWYFHFVEKYIFVETARQEEVPDKNEAVK